MEKPWRIFPKKMTQWTNTLVHYNEQTKLAQKTFCDNHGQNLGACHLDRRNVYILLTIP